MVFRKVGPSKVRGGTSDDSHKPNPDEPSYLSFVSTGESTISLNKIGNPDPIILEYSTNGSTWTPYTIGGAITISNGEKLMFRAGETGNECFSKGYDDYYQFEISGEVAAKGNIMLLLDRNCVCNSVPSHAFFNLFKDCQSLTSAPELPATELASGCYGSMFKGCTSLTKAPELPATELAWECYYGMFSDCKSLIDAPVLPATELARNCYYSMFYGCTSLKTAPILPAKNLAYGCYYCMFSGCTSLTKAPDLPATELAEWCYYGMFYGCTSLTTAPELLATKLAWEVLFWYVQRLHELKLCQSVVYR